MVNSVLEMIRLSLINITISFRSAYLSLVSSKDCVEFGVDVGREALVDQNTVSYNCIIKLAHVGDTKIYPGLEFFGSA